MVVPMLWMLLASFKQRNEIYTIPSQWLPHALQWQNYADVFATVPFAHFLLNSVITTVAGAGLKGRPGAHVRLRARLRRVPRQAPRVRRRPRGPHGAAAGDAHPELHAHRAGRLAELLPGDRAPGLASSLGTFLFRQHFQTLPASVLEAATLDGAGHWRRLWQFVVPLSAPTVSAVALVSVVGEWNQYLWPLSSPTGPR